MALMQMICLLGWLWMVEAASTTVLFGWYFRSEGGNTTLCSNGNNDILSGGGTASYVYGTKRDNDISMYSN